MAPVSLGGAFGNGGKAGKVGGGHVVGGGLLPPASNRRTFEVRVADSVGKRRWVGARVPRGVCHR